MKSGPDTGYFLKILNMYLVGIWVDKLGVNCKSNQKVIKMDLVGPCWVFCFRTHHVLTMYPVGKSKLPSVGSVLGTF